MSATTLHRFVGLRIAAALEREMVLGYGLVGRDGTGC